MKIKTGEFADGFAWFVEDDNAHIVETGWESDPTEARRQAEQAAWFWKTHDYEQD